MPMSPLNVLIIDDDMIDREAVKRYLKNSNRREFVFHEADMGAKASEMMKSQSFDCVFLDYLLPDMDGVSFLKQVYDPETDLAPAPVVMLTGQGNEAIMLDALRRGAQDYLIKDHISQDNLNISIVKAREIFELKKSRKLAEDQLHQIHKLEAVGQLTSGVAHDFNNLLTVVLGNTRLLRKRLNAGKENLSIDDATNKIQAIETAAKRGAEMVSRLMVFTRQRPISAQTTNSNDCINETLELLKRAVGPTVEINIILEPDPWPIQVDITQFGNALINMGVNARDAMSKGGKLTIETANVTIGSDYAITRPDVTPGPYVMIAISDTGSGISPETMKKIFDPFFTTKPTGKGTGLGLAMVYGFINQSGGHITVYSEEGHGTVFRIYLPRLSDLESNMDAQAEAEIIGGTETILVAEDNEEIRNVVGRMLEKLGYQVVLAENGRVALEIIKREPEKFDLIFSDVIMTGGITGLELVQEARNYSPSIKALYTSGYTEKSFPNYQLQLGEELISKPYQKHTLAKKIRNILDSKGIQ